MTTASLKCVLLSLGLATLATASRAHAEPSAADRETARSLMTEGDKKLAAKDAPGAMRAYRAAHEIMKVPSTGASYAEAAVAAGFFVEARDACLQVARIAVGAGEPPAFQRARASCAELVPKADTQIATLVIKYTPPPGAGDPTATLDGVALPGGALLVPRKVNPGKHVVTATLAGYLDERQEVTVEAGKSSEVVLAFKKGGAAAESKQPPAASEPPAPTATAGRSPLVYAGFGIGAAGLLAGGITGGLSLSKASDAKAGCVDNHCPPANKSAGDSAHALGNVSTIGFGVGLVGIGVGVYGLVANRPAATSASAWSRRAVQPVFGPTSLGVRGQF